MNNNSNADGLKRIENNFKYHKPNDNQIYDYQLIRTQAKGMAVVFENLCPNSREKSLAMTKLEEAVMWANASIARNQQE